MILDDERLNALAYYLGEVDAMLEEQDRDALRERIPILRQIITELAAIDGDSLDENLRHRRDMMELEYRRVIEQAVRELLAGRAGLCCGPGLVN